MILAKASELSKPRSPAGDRSGSALSLEEIKAIATEVGLDPEAVVRAAHLLALEAEPSRVEHLLGGPLRYRLDVRSGVPITEAKTARLLAAVRAEAEQHGEGTSDAAGMSWHTVGEGSQVVVTAHAEGDGTRVRLLADRSGALAVTGTFTLLGTLTSGIAVLVAGKMGAYDSALVGLTLFGGASAGVVALARGLWGQTGRALKKRLVGIHQAVERVMSEE